MYTGLYLPPFHILYIQSYTVYLRQKVFINVKLIHNIHYNVWHAEC